MCLFRAGTKCGTLHLLPCSLAQQLFSKPEAGNPESYFHTPIGCIRGKLGPFLFPSFSPPFSLCGNDFLTSPPGHLNLISVFSSSEVDTWSRIPCLTCQQHEQVALFLGSAQTLAWLLDSGTIHLKRGHRADRGTSVQAWAEPC